MRIAERFLEAKQALERERAEVEHSEEDEEISGPDQKNNKNFSLIFLPESSLFYSHTPYFPTNF